jgi:hypothetical protein
MIGILVSHFTQRAKAGLGLLLHVAFLAFFENEIVPPNAAPSGVCAATAARLAALR